jgi:plastocyanin
MIEARGRRSALLPCAVLLIVVLAACTAVEARDDHRYTVEMTGTEQFAPAVLRLRSGATVVWHNASLEPHTATTGTPGGVSATPAPPAGAEPWDSGTLNAGEMWARTFDATGTYVYHCRFHGDEGMVGTIVVEGR